MDATNKNELRWHLDHTFSFASTVIFLLLVLKPKIDLFAIEKA